MSDFVDGVKIDPKTGRRKWDKKEWEDRAKERLELQPEPYKIWASQKSHRPKHLDKNLELRNSKRAKEKRARQKQAEAAAAAEKIAKPKYDNKNPDNIEQNSENYKKFFAESRGYNFDFEGGVGQSNIVQQGGSKKGSAGRNMAGYYCNVCDCTLADNRSWLGHLNGRRHQRNLGQSVFKHKRSDVNEVMTAISLKKKQIEEKQEAYSFKDKIREAEEMEEKLRTKYKFEQKQRKKAKKRKLEEEAGPAVDVNGEAVEAGETIDEETGEKRAKNLDELVNDQEEMDMMAMMGFGGFSSSKKAK